MCTLSRKRQRTDGIQEIAYRFIGRHDLPFSWENSLRSPTRSQIGTGSSISVILSFRDKPLSSADHAPGERLVESFGFIPPTQSYNSRPGVRASGQEDRHAPGY